MSGQFWLTREQMERLWPPFPRARGKPRVDDRRVLSGILHVLRNGLRWQDAPAVYGPHKTQYNALSVGRAWGCSLAFFVTWPSPARMATPS